MLKVLYNLKVIILVNKNQLLSSPIIITRISITNTVFFKLCTRKKKGIL